MYDISRTDIEINFRDELILQMLDCRSDSPVYEEFYEELQECKEYYKPLIKTQVCTKQSTVSNAELNIEGDGQTEVIMALVSVGDVLTQASSLSFSQGDYVKGTILDKMADDALFQLEDIMKSLLKEQCEAEKIGITQRLEPSSQLPIEYQKVIYDTICEDYETSVKLLDSYMLSPVKSMCIVYVINRIQCTEMKLDHDCSQCTNLLCSLRKNNDQILVVRKPTGKVAYERMEGESILSCLHSNGEYITALCNGNGTCGKCAIRVCVGNVPITKEDKDIFNEKELEYGKRLACKAFPIGKCEIELMTQESDIHVAFEKEEGIITKKNSVDEEINCIMVVDLGTTTIAVRCIDCNTNEVVCEYATVNKQRSYGGDVISRIAASNKGMSQELQKCVWKALDEAVESFTNQNFVVSEIYLAANTTMVHLLMGYSCETLGVYPFVPVCKDLIETSFCVKGTDVKMTILPAVSTFVGGDIIAGILACRMDCKKGITMLIDLGTNGEMAIGNQERIMVTSTAAGPAFEGGEISCGCASVGGAINMIRLEQGKVKDYTTIHGKDAIGICGTGIIDLCAELLREDVIDETGKMADEYFETGFQIIANDTKDLCFTQKDIREIQLAKAAIRAGIETLIEEYKVSYQEVEKVYLAGGFGMYIDVNRCMEIGMFPNELEGKIEAVGNSSIQGCQLFASDETVRMRANKISSKAIEINLNKTAGFNDYYMDAMMFEV